MGQANNSGRNASLDEHKARAAGRQKENPGPYPASRDDFDTKKPGHRQAGGASGAGRTGGKRRTSR